MSKRQQQLSVVAPLEPNPGLHFLGRVNIKCGMRPTPWFKPASLPYEHACEYFDPDDQTFDARRLAVQPGKETYLADLATTLGDPPKYKATERSLDDSVRAFGSRLGLRRVLDDARWAAPAAVRTNGKASSGLVLEPLGRTRGQCAHAIEQLGGHVAELSKAGPLPGAAPWYLGGRAKRTTPEIGDTLRSRAIIFDDGVSANVSSTISQSIGESIKDAHGDIKIGHRAMQGASSDARASERNDKEFEIDHKRFGFRLAEPLLVTAFGVIRALLPPGEEWDNRILHEMSHCILKTIILPGGWVYRCTFGNWSGPWTSILDSICNWLAVTNSLYDLKIRKSDVDLWIYGDDTLIGFRNQACPRWLTPPHVQDLLKRKFGIYAGECNVGSLSSYGNEAGATFLGCWNKDGKHGRPLGKWVDISLYPEKQRAGWNHQMSRMKYLSHAAVATTDNEEYFTSYFTWLNDKATGARRAPVSRLRQSLNRLFNVSHANFSSGAVDWRDWEYGVRTELSELKKSCRRYHAEWFRWDQPDRPPPDHLPPHAKWLRRMVGGGLAAFCGVQAADVAWLSAPAPAPVL
jgi:hypothetical protein